MKTPIPNALPLVLALAGVILAGCDRGDAEAPVTIRFWAMGREGEVVRELLPAFVAENPGVRVDLQQIPWTAAHEKLLTAYVGGSTPDIAQLGNTWISEFSALRALAPVDESHGISRHAFFEGIWDTNVIDGIAYGIPWYVDTRVLFYRKDILREAGYDTIPATWMGWLEAMRATKRAVGADRYAFFCPLNEWTQPVIFGLQAGSPLLVEENTRGAFSQPPFDHAFAFFMTLFRERLAPPVTNNEVANLYQEFARGTFAMYVTGPWNLGEFRRRLPADLSDAWSTAPLPGPDGPGVSLAGGSSLVVFERSRQKDAAWRLVAFLSRPEQQIRFFQLTGDLPAAIAAWNDPALTADREIRAFRRQLERVVSTPKVPEWELIATRLQQRAELAVRGAAGADSALALLDRDVAAVLEKRRWLHARGRLGGAEGGEP